MRLTAPTAPERREKGSVLALVPAGFLVLMLLGGLAVDSAVAYQGRQQLHDALSAAANDAVAAGLSDSSFYREGALSLDPAAVVASVCRSIGAQGLGSVHRLHIAVAVGGRSVLVEGTGQVDAVFGRALPGFGVRQVSSSAEATLSTGGQDGAGPSGPPVPVDCG